MGKIIILDENTANKIAAGEVIERPASVIKELVENAIDAGATNISVEIRNGGISFIRVIDNGSGLAEDDVEIAFERHSTSKIRRADDLESISSMGFRGEALASIAAVSAVQLSTRVKTAVQGVSIEVKGGCILDLKPVGCPIGTSITVRELFFNTPARYKFLKKDSTEAAYTADVLSRIALGYPDISFKLVSSGTVVLHTPGNGDLKSAIFSIYGAETAKQLIEVQSDDGRVRISGYIGKPELSRSNRNQQSFYINRRYIRSKTVTSALDGAYSTFLMKNRYAFALLDIRLNQALVDVNVHPSKMEVKFSGEQDIYRAVYHAVNSALLSRSAIRTLPEHDRVDRNTFYLNEKAAGKPAYTQQAFEWVRKELDQKRADAATGKPWDRSADISDAADKNPLLSGENKDEDKLKQDHIGREDAEQREATREIEQNARREVAQEDERKNTPIAYVQYERNKAGIITGEAVGQAVAETAEEILAAPGLQHTPAHAPANKDHPSYPSATGMGYQNTAALDTQNSDASLKASFPSLFEGTRIIGQAFSTYILLEREEELFLLDQHAAHERIRYEELKAAYEKNEPVSQTLLAVVPVELTVSEYQFALSEAAFFENLGFTYESFGTNSILLRSVPFDENGLNIKEMFMEILDFVMNGSKGPKGFIADEALYTMACKAAVKARSKLDTKEIEALLDSLAALENPYTCPHGRPAILKLRKNELEKLFKRIV